jgi:hypothetical protein
MSIKPQPVDLDSRFNVPIRKDGALTPTSNCLAPTCICLCH